MGSAIDPVLLGDRFSAFKVSTHTYKSVEDQPILVDILIPKTLLDTPSKGSSAPNPPVFIRIHGGWLVGGSRDFPDWCPAWNIELILKYGGILVQPDYRLLPEATGEEIIDDMHDFWAWLGKDFSPLLQEHGIKPDLSRVLISGESAGGYLSLQTALTFLNSTADDPDAPRIRILVSNFPMLYLSSPWYSQRYEKPIFGAPQLPEAMIDDHLASIAKAPKRPIVLNAPMVESPRGALAIALVQHGRFLDVLGKDRDPTPGKRRLHPEEMIADGHTLPPTLFLHGTDDSAVPVTGTDDFIKLLKEKKAVAGLEEGKEEKEVLGYIRVPGDHGFNLDVKLGDAEWTGEAKSFIEKHWLG